MKFVICTIKDKKANALEIPFFAQTEGMAIRSFNELVKDNRSNVSKYPEDYALILIGSYDSELGIISDCDHANLAEAKVLANVAKTVGQDNKE